MSMPRTGMAHGGQNFVDLSHTLAHYHIIQENNLYISMQNGQWQQTVNLPSSEFEGSNPSSSTNYKSIAYCWFVG